MSSEAVSTTDPPHTGNRIKSLDGIRAVAISLVLYSHAVSYPGVHLPFIDDTLVGNCLRQLSRYGVLLFFVLSGYLITTLLLKERSRTGTISLTRFWYRRAFRILPVFLAYISVVAALTVAGYLSITKSAFIAAVTYTWNYPFLLVGPEGVGEDAPALGQLWSLSVEEQFYVFFPLLACWLSPKKVFWFCFALILATPAIRLGQYYLSPSTRDYGPIMGHTMFGVSIAYGCLLAVAEQLDMANRARNWLSGTVAFGLAFVYGFAIHPMLSVIFKGKWSLPIGESLAGLSAVIIIAYSIRHADTTRVGRVLNWRPVVLMGVLSYSIYIWHQLFYHVNFDGVPMLLSRLLLTALGLATATVSYFCLESPMLRLRNRIEPWVFRSSERSLANTHDDPPLVVATDD